MSGTSTPYHTKPPPIDRKSTRLNSSHLVISYAVFCLKKKIGDVGGVVAYTLQVTRHEDEIDGHRNRARIVRHGFLKFRVIRFFFFIAARPRIHPLPPPPRLSPD